MFQNMNKFYLILLPKLKINVNPGRDVMRITAVSLAKPGVSISALFLVVTFGLSFKLPL